MNDNAGVAPQLPEIDWGPWGTPGPLRAENINLHHSRLHLHTEVMTAAHVVANSLHIAAPQSGIEALLKADGRNLMVSVFLAAFAATGGVVGCLFILFGLRKLIFGE